MSLSIDNKYDESAEASRYAAAVVEEYKAAVAEGQDPRAYLKEHIKSIDETTQGLQYSMAAQGMGPDRGYYEIRKIFIAGKRALQNQLSKLPAVSTTGGRITRQRKVSRKKNIIAAEER